MEAGQARPWNHDPTCRSGAETPNSWHSVKEDDSQEAETPKSWRTCAVDDFGEAACEEAVTTMAAVANVENAEHQQPGENVQTWAESLDLDIFLKEKLRHAHQELSAGTNCNTSQLEEGAAANAPTSQRGECDMSDEECEALSGGRRQQVDLDRVAHLLSVAAPKLEQLRKRKVVVLVGKTGAGKTTLIHAIAGRRLRPVHHTTMPASSLAAATARVVYEADEPIEGFEIGHEQTSQTTHINLFFKEEGDGDGIVYVDAPGLGDTAGIEVDIATSMLFRTAAEYCSAMRFVVLIDCVSIFESRGGGVRSIMKFVSSCVKDFRDRPCVFSFLFTHVDALTCMTNLELDVAREKLRHDLEETWKGTTDEGEKHVLKWMVHCLKRKLPFVDIFHPEKTNLPQLITNIELFMCDYGGKPTAVGMKKDESTTRIVRCGLSDHAQARLQMELTYKAEELKLELQNENFYKVASIVATFRSIMDNLPFSFVSEIGGKALDALGQYTQTATEHAYDLIENGTNSNRDFSAHHAEGALLTMAILHSLEIGAESRGQEILAYLRQRIARMLKLLCDALQVEKPMLDDVHGLLANLYAWGEAHEEFRGAVKLAVAALEEAVCIAIESNTDAQQNASSESLGSCIQLELFRQHAARLRGFGLSAPKLEAACRAGCDFEEAAAKRSGERAEEALQGEAEGSMNQRLQVYVEEVHKLEVQSEVLSHASVLPELANLIDKIWSTVCHEAHEKLASQADDARAFLQANEFEKLKLKMEGLQALYDAQSDKQRHRFDFNSQVYAARDEVAAALQTQMASAHALSSQMDEMGLGPPERHTARLSILAACRWFDIHLPSDRRFLDRGVQELNKKYDEFSQARRLEARDSLVSFLAQPVTQKCKLNGLGRCLQELLGFAAFRTLYPAVADAQQQFIEEATATLEKWSTDHEGELRSLPLDVLELEKLPAEKVNDILTVLQSLKPIAFPCFPQLTKVSAMIRVEESLTKALGSCSNNIQELQARKGEFDTKHLVFKALTKWQSLDELKVALPSLQTFRHAVTDEVTSTAKEIRLAICNSPNWEQAAADLTALKKACMLDEFIFGKAHDEASDLEQLLQWKRKGVDETFQRKLEAYDFNGFHDILQPLAKSPDPLVRARYGELLNAAGNKVELKISFAIHNIRQGPVVADAVSILLKANDELGEALKAHHAIDVACSVGKLHSLAAEHMKDVLNELASAVRAKNFANVALAHHTMMQYQHALQHTFDLELKERVEKEVQQMHDMLMDVKAKLFAFADNARRPSQERTDMSELYLALGNMKTARATSLDAVPDDIELFYRDAVKELMEQLQTLHRELQNTTDENQFFVAVEVYTYLKKEWESGLSEHVSDLNFDIATELDKCRCKEQEIVEKYQAYLRTPDDIDSHWRPLLEQESRHSWPWWHSKQYERIRHLLMQEVHTTTEIAADSLREGKFEVTGNCAAVVLHIYRTLRQHIDVPFVSSRLAAIQDAVLSTCHAMSESLHDALLRDDITDFELIFMRFYKLMLHLMCPFPELKRMSGSIHAMVCAAIDAKLARYRQEMDALDFVTAAKSVKMLQRVSFVFTGTIMMYINDIHTGSMDAELEHLHGLCQSHFGGTRLAKMGQHFAVLEISLDASQQEVKQAYRRKSREHHPDMHRRRGVHRKNPHEQQQRVQSAYEALEQKRHREQHSKELSNLFTQEIRDLGMRLRAAVQQCIESQDYSRLKKVFMATKDLKILKEIVPCLDVQKVAAEVHDAIQAHVCKIQANIRSSWNRREQVGQLAQIQNAMTSLSQLEDHFAMYPDLVSDKVSRDVRKWVEAEIQKLASKAGQCIRGSSAHVDAHQRDFASSLITIGWILDELPQFAMVAKMEINNLLESCQQQTWGSSYLFGLGILLCQGSVGRLGDDGKVLPEDERIGKIIANDFRQFNDVLTVMWNEHTEVSQKDIHTVVADVQSFNVSSNGARSSMPVDRASLQEGFERYQRLFEQHFLSWRAGELQLDGLVSLVARRAEAVRECTVTSWTREVKEAIPDMLAGIFTFLMISKCGDSYNRLKEEETNVVANGAHAVTADSVLLKPHSIQVITLLRILGYDSRQEVLDNHLMHVRTGEGKSMILGGCSVLLGLLGFRVRCMCYSRYLSQRDHMLFKDLFQAFEVEGRIQYSTITDYSWDVIQAKGDISALTSDLLQEKDLSISAAQEFGSRFQRPLVETKNLKEILLVDEIDIFFGKEFYGSSFGCVASLRGPEVTDIVNLVWNSRTRSPKPRKLFDVVVRSKEYRALIEKFSEWAFVVKAEVLQMCHDVYQFEDPDLHYDRATNKVGLKIMDSIEFGWSRGYRTTFKYLHEREKKNLRDEAGAMLEALVLKVKAGQFSYANIHPACILGVSGTIEAMGKYEWEVLHRYKVQVYSKLPSVYGTSNFQFLEQDAAIKIVPSEEHFQAITDAVKSKVRIGRAVIVFFQDALQLSKYVASPFYRQIANRNELKEKQSNEEKAYTIKKAATSGQATFSTSVFGRGTDFVCNDRKLLDAGGVHIVQAFLSVEASEELQIQGRTARQGKKGSYSMLLNADDLHQQFGIAPDQTRDMPPTALYKILDNARNKLRQAYSESIEGMLAEATEMDNLSHAYFDKLLANDVAAAAELLKDLYKRR